MAARCNSCTLSASVVGGAQCVIARLVVVALVFTRVRVLVQHAKKPLGRSGAVNGAVLDDLVVVQAPAVECLIVIQVLAEGSSGQGNTSEQALGARPTENLGVHLGVGLSRGGASDRAGGHGGIATQCKLAGEQID